MDIENVIDIEVDASEAKEGLSAYEVYLKNGGTLSEEEWLESLKGDTGPTGANGIDGKSAYESWLDAGNTGTEEDFLNSLKGEKGDTGPTGAKGDTGPTGANGIDGKSAYESWLDAGNTGTEEDFINSLKGEKGDTGPTGANGKDGKSAYEIWLEAGNTGTEEDFLNSLKGDSSSISEIIEDTDMTIKDSGIYRVLASDQVSLRIGATSNIVAKYYQPGDYLFWNKEDSYLITLNKAYSSAYNMLCPTIGSYFVKKSGDNYQGYYRDVVINNISTINESQTISGTKTFSTLPESSVIPTTDNQLTNKKYVDDAITAAITTSLEASY